MPDAPPAIVIGAGPAGLAVGACLRRAGLSSLILERGHEVGAAWRRHYDRLHLHTDKGHSQLPFVPFPASCPRYPSRLQLLAYLEAYARAFELDIRFGQEVASARRANGGWDVRSQNAEYRAPSLVVAAGYNREPYVPVWPGQAGFRGTLLHSANYRDGAPFGGRRVLVVGFGNSGGEIAIDLCEHGADVSLAVRGPVNVIPRELFGIPILSIGIVQSRLPPRVADALNRPVLRAVIGDLAPYGLRRSRAGTMTRIRRDARIPLIDVGTIDLIKQGRIAVRPGIEAFTGDGVVFNDGRRQPFDAVIVATGFRPRVNGFLRDAAAAHDAEGTPSSSGREALPGLYFCGYYVSPTGMLREIAREAKRIADAITRAATSGVPSR